MTAIHELGHAHGIAVIDDCAQAHSAHIHGQSVDVGAWG
jgi:dTDP-4-amino-4,6-dideoxygalactose transaminase